MLRRAFRIVALGMLCLGVLCGFHFRDFNRDRTYTIACLGDSNTNNPATSRTVPSWCDILGSTLTPKGWRFYNYGVAGANVVLNGKEQLVRALNPAPDHHKPDAVIMAFGTNDIRWFDTERILVTYHRLFAMARSHRVLPLIALAPPVVCLFDEHRVEELNQTLVRRFPDQFLIDFFTGIDASGKPGSDFTSGDCIHVNAQGQRKRAKVVYEFLTESLPSHLRDTILGDAPPQ